MSKKEIADNQRERGLRKKTLKMLSILATSMVCMTDMTVLYSQSMESVRLLQQVRAA